MTFTGMVVRESLGDATVLDRLNVPRVETWNVGDSAVAGQTRVWTATYFDGPERDADSAAAALAEAIYPDRPWYANMGTAADEFVIFHNKVIKYRRGDVAAYRSAQDYARAIGVPGHQLAWSGELESCARPQGPHRAFVPPWRAIGAQCGSDESESRLRVQAPMGESIGFDGITGYLANGRDAGVVVLHEWWGLVPHIRDVADRFAAEGFTALAPDLYHGATAGSDEPDLAEKLMMQMQGNSQRAVTEARLAITELRRRGCATVGVVGFCLGGAVALAVSGDLLCLEWGGQPLAQERMVDATVAFYGIWPKSGEDTIATPVLVHVAEHEEHNPPALPENFPKWFEGMDNVEMHIYPGTQHAFFNNSHGPDCYDEGNARLAWDRTIAILRRHVA